MIVVNVANGGVSMAIGYHSCFDSHVGTEEYLGNVVDEFNGVGVHGWNAHFHDCGSNKDKGNVGEGNRNGSAKFGESPSLSFMSKA